MLYFVYKRILNLHGSKHLHVVYMYTVKLMVMM